MILYNVYIIYIYLYMYSPGDLGIASLTPFSRDGDRMGQRGRLF